jgi:glutamate synthase (ferredoxin)
MVGQSQKINMEDAVKNYKTKGINLSKILYKPDVPEDVSLKNNSKQNHNLEKVIDFKILSEAKLAIEKKVKMSLSYKIQNTDRTVGAILSNEISKLYGAKGLPNDTLKLNFKGAAGQSFGAFSTKGLTMKVNGNTNDYFGKGLSGAKIIVKIPKESTIISHKNVITGNTALYGATSGEAYINGIAGERFCVRNSGAIAVVEGVGDHGCEYMTGGIALILGDVGRNFAAGMSGGIAYIYKSEKFDKRNFNMEMIAFENPNDQDLDYINKLIENHFSYTSSKLAEDHVTHSNKEAKNFIKILPTEYKLALEKMAKEKISEIIN